MANKATKEGRRKIPLFDHYIISGEILRVDDKKYKLLQAKLIILEREYQAQLKHEKIEGKMLEKLLHQISVLTGQIKAPECVKCGEPKKAGGIQWIDHVKCERKDDEVDEGVSPPKFEVVK